MGKNKSKGGERNDKNGIEKRRLKGHNKNEIQDHFI